MTTYSEDFISTWRNCADQLTAKQYEHLADIESRNADDATARQLLVMARQYASENLNSAVHFGHLDQPDGTAAIGPARQTINGDWYRSFVGTERCSELCSLSLYFTQFDDGKVDLSVRIALDEFGVEVTYCTADNARELACDLVEIADELDRRAKDS